MNFIQSYFYCYYIIVERHIILGEEGDIYLYTL